MYHITNMTREMVGLVVRAGQLSQYSYSCDKGMLTVVEGKARPPYSVISAGDYMGRFASVEEKSQFARIVGETQMENYNYYITGVTTKVSEFIRRMRPDSRWLYNLDLNVMRSVTYLNLGEEITATDYVTTFGTAAQQREFRKETTNYKVTNGTEQVYDLIRRIAGFDKCTEHASALYIFADRSEAGFTTITAAGYIKMFGSPEDQVRGGLDIQLPSGRIVGKGEEEPVTSEECRIKVSFAFPDANNDMIERDGPTVNYIVKDCPNEVLTLLIRAARCEKFWFECKSNNLMLTHTDNNDDAPVELSAEDFLNKFGTVAQQQELVKITQLANSNLRMIVNTDVTSKW